MITKTNVKIYGQEYIISGEKPEEEIQKVGEYVDNKMHLIAKMTGKTSNANIAVLTAVNAADEYFSTLDEMEQMKAEKERMGEEAQHYETMLAESKKSFEECRAALEKLKNDSKEQQEKYSELEKKCSDYENTIFDLQMENIQLKSELEKTGKYV